MAITINGKEYDETTLDNNVKNSILQVQSSNQAIVRLQAEILNHQILSQHHSKVVQDGLPADEEKSKDEIITEAAEKAIADAPAETATE